MLRLSKRLEGTHLAKTLYLIGGPMGVGKTAVCRELNRKLPASVMLDGDWCWCADPFQVTEETKRMVLDNICHLLGNFLRCSTYENVILCWVMHERAIIDDILGKLPIEECDAKVCAVSLVADVHVPFRFLADSSTTSTYPRNAQSAVKSGLQAALPAIISYDYPSASEELT